jgi:hypothetical protein
MKFIKKCSSDSVIRYRRQERKGKPKMKSMSFSQGMHCVQSAIPKNWKRAENLSFTQRKKPGS